MRIVFDDAATSQLIELAKTKRLYLEGNILKVIDTVDGTDFDTYISDAIEKDTESRKKRLEMTRVVQDQNKELHAKAIENDKLMSELKEALESAEHATETALNDLSLMQQKTQFELIGNIVQIALWVIVGVGIVVTGMYLFAMSMDSTETTLIGNTWSNLFGILLTNSFSIIGTIMGVKYAQSDEKK